MQEKKKIKSKDSNLKMGRGSKQTFSQMASRYMKWCSVLLIIKEMQHKTIVRHYLTPVRMTVIKKTRKNNYW